MNIDYLPPHSDEAEQACLGACILDAQTAFPVLLEAFQNQQVFFDLRNQAVFEAILWLWNELNPVNALSVAETLRAAGKLGQCGGIQYLESLQDICPSPSGVEYFATIVEEHAVKRRMIRILLEGVEKAYKSDAPCDEVVSGIQRDVLAVRKDTSNKTPAIGILVQRAIDQIESWHQNQGATNGLSTGLKDVDKVTDGLHPSELIVVAGYPGFGKSAIAMNIAEHVAIEQKHPVGVFSLEMSAMRLVVRMMASKGRVNLRDARVGKLVDSDFPKLLSAGSALKQSGLHFCDMSDLTILQLRAKARQMVLDHGVKLIVVDYIQLLSGAGKKDQSREQEVSSISRGLKKMSTELNVPVIALSQLNDDGLLRESRAIGQDADGVWILKRKDDKENTDAIPMILEIKKQRDGQAPVLIELVFLKSFTRFENSANPFPKH